MEPKKNKPRLHHYLPRFYLEGFTDPHVQRREGKNVIWVYEKGKPIRRSTPEKEARERDFYAFHKNGARDFRAEEWLGTVEHNVAPIIKRLQDVRYALTPAEREWIAVFVGTMHTRTPAGRKLMDTRIGPAAAGLMKEAAKDMDEFRSLCRSLDVSIEPTIDLDEVRQDILAGRGDIISERPDFKMASVIEVGRMEGEVLFRLDWHIVHADGSEFFLTSDNPVVAAVWEQERRLAHFHMGFDNTGVDIYFPLNRTMCLRMKNGIEPGPCRIPDRGVRLVNKATMLCTHCRVYAAEHSRKLKILFDRRGCEASIESFRPAWKGKPI